VLVKDVREKIQKHIRQYCRRLDIRILAIGGHIDHLHLLIKQPPERSVSVTINLIKGESSHWINSNNIFPYKFVWQKRYAAFSVSPDEVKRVIAYIQNQEKRHCP
jgi:putative transposase